MKINRLLFHMQNGTLSGILKFRWHKFVKNRRLISWLKRSREKEYIEKVIDDNVKIRLYHDSRLAGLIYFDYYEKSELQFLKSFLRPDDIFIDLGANIGLYTLIAASSVGNGGHVYAIEPHSRAYERLIDNIAVNGFGNTSCYRYAVSDCSEQVELNILTGGYDAWSSLAEPEKGSSFIKEFVDAVTLDSFVDEYDLVGRIRMIKVDIEGWESRFLAGAHETLSRDDAPVLQLEFAEQACRLAGSSCAQLYRALRKLDYKLYAYDSKKNRLKYEPFCDYYSYENLIAVKDIDQIEVFI